MPTLEERLEFIALRYFKRNFRTAKDLKEFMKSIPDDAFVCPVRKRRINGVYFSDGIIFYRQDGEDVFNARLGDDGTDNDI